MLGWLCCIVHGFLWIKIVSYTWIHKDKKMLSTLSHAHRVIKIDYLTLKQAQKNVATTEQRRLLKQTCGTP
jgi:hypothetical protein